MVMKLKNDIILKKVLDDYVAIVNSDNDSDFNGVIYLNDTSRRILELIQLNNEIDTIVSTLLDEYDSSETEIRAEVQNVIEQFKIKGIIS